MILLRKFRSAIYHLGVFKKQNQDRLALYLEKRMVVRWFKTIEKTSPKVFLGANIHKPNGVDFHIHAIQKNSQLNPVLVPADYILKKMGMDDFLNKYLEKLPLPERSVIHSHVYPKYVLWCQQQKQRDNSLKWIHTYHAHYFPEYSEGQFLEWQIEFNRVFVEVASKADMKISVSKWQQTYYKKNFDIDTIYIPNGVDVVQCDRADPTYFQKMYGIEGFILNVSRHDPVKNPREFVALAASMPTHTFVIIGMDLSYSLFVDHYHITPPQNLIIFGKLSQIEVQQAIAACSCLVSTAKREGLPTLVLEGMAHGKPVVVSNEPGSMEAIGHGEYGCYYELGNLEELKQKTLLAIEDKKIGIKARDRVLEEYDWRVVAKKLDRIYSE